MTALQVRERLRLNLGTLSRTLMTGHVSTGSTPGKDEALALATKDDVRRTTEANAGTALDLVEELLVDAAAPLDLRVVTEEINAIFGCGVLKPGLLYRKNDPASGFPYLPAAAILEYAAFFYRMGGQSTAGDVDVAAWAIWAIDLRGHLFADGCGKTATLVSGLILARAGLTIPLYTSRDAYYAAPYAMSGAMSWRAWRAYFISITG
ncbi:MAG: hypothetical protein JWM27_4099 [Gemmatimonadetes bacterium]|nr:hypothetical protein [Gemmatimonadota bacterium]